MNKVVKFSSNWNNKLNCKVFTTFRLTDTGYYIAGDKYDILQTDKKRSLHFGTSELIDAYRCLLKDVPQALTLLDTGYPKDDFIKMVKTMYKNKNIDFDKKKFAFYFFKYV